MGAPDFSDPTNARVRTFTDELGRGHSLALNGQIQIPSVPLAVLPGHTCPAPRTVPGWHHSLPPHRLCMEPPHSIPSPSLLVGLKVMGKSFLGPVLPGDPGRTGTGPGAEPKWAEYGTWRQAGGCLLEEAAFLAKAASIAQKLGTTVCSPIEPIRAECMGHSFYEDRNVPYLLSPVW